MKYIYLSLLSLLFLNLILANHVTFLKNKKPHGKLANTHNSTPAVSDGDEPKVHSGYCLMKVNNYFYDLTPLWARNSTSYYKTYTKSGEQINFNICGRNAHSVCSNRNSMVVSNIRCVEYGGDIDEDRIWTVSQNDKNRSVLTLELPNGEVCKRNGTQLTFYKTYYQFTCDETKRFEVDKSSVFDSTSCTNTIKMNTAHACPSSKFRPWYKQFGLGKKAVGVILILIGLYFMILGQTLWKFNGFIINFAIQGLIIYSFLNIFVNANMMLCIILGLILSLAVMYFEKASAVTLGIVVGYLFGTLSYNVFVKILPVNPQSLYWGLIITSIIGLAVLGGFIDAYMIVLATSLVGGYAFVRGISVFAGHYPDESYVMKLINAGEYSQFGRVYGSHIYLYMLGIVLATGLGYLIQALIMPAPEAKGKEAPNQEEPKPNNTNNNTANQAGTANQNAPAETSPATQNNNNPGENHPNTDVDPNKH